MLSRLGLEALEERNLLAAYIPATNTDQIWVDTGDSNHPQDVIPRFVLPSDGNVVVPSKGTDTTLYWHDTGIWPGGNLPTSSTRVRVPNGKTLVVDTDSAVVKDLEVYSGGTLKFQNTSLSSDIKLTFDTLTVLPDDPATQPLDPGKLEIDFSGVTGHNAELVVRNTALAAATTTTPGVDPYHWGQGLLVFGDATLKGNFTGPTFVAIASGAASNTSTATLAQDVTWASGDDLVFPDTRQKSLSDGLDDPDYSAANDYANYQLEQRDFSSYNSTSNQLTLQSNLANNHAKLNVESVDYLPHVGNITRNVIVRSDNAAGTRGHTVFAGTGRVDIEYVQFKDLGRTTEAAPALAA